MWSACSRALRPSCLKCSRAWCALCPTCSPAWLASRPTCSRVWSVSPLLCSSASRVSLPTCFLASRVSCLTCSWVLLAFVFHSSRTLGVLKSLVLHSLQVSHVPRTLMRLISPRFCVLRLFYFWYFGYLSCFAAWTTVNPMIWNFY